MKRSSTGGISLVETLVAFAISSLIVSAVLEAAIFAIKGEKRRLELAINSELALSVLKAWYVSPDAILAVVERSPGFVIELVELPSKVVVPLGMKGRLAYISAEVSVQLPGKSDTQVLLKAEKAVAE